jgi:hypothetical protein
VQVLFKGTGQMMKLLQALSITHCSSLSSVS